MTSVLAQRLAEVPAVALMGPRQVGKTTLALNLHLGKSSVYLDLESETDRAKLGDPELYLERHTEDLVILDEVHRMPDIFQPLRGMIDQGRRTGRGTGRFLLLGSASIDLLKQSGETLAGRVGYLELTPIDLLDLVTADVSTRPSPHTLWVHGGFPDSLLSSNDAQSMRWRLDFIRTYLERDIPQFGPRIPAETLRRFWTMLAHHHGGLLNAAQLARGLGVDGKTVTHYLDLLVDLLLVRRLPVWHGNLGKRLVRSPKVYVRDSGILHALLGLSSYDEILGHPIAGPSWEGFVIETLLAAAPAGTDASFYRTAAGAEIDLVLTLPGQRLWAIEIKLGKAPTVDRGFHSACADLAPERRFVVYAGEERYPMGNETEAISLLELGEALVAIV
ncbi:MAG TPA: ATP-binding protein [Gemmatimonadaceae bacterium]|jgi:predicted AAA+ superfamily ATPase|nr:ATP-binding protein [Gemmatimonadaceae bacterium]